MKYIFLFIFLFYLFIYLIFKLLLFSGTQLRICVQVATPLMITRSKLKSYGDRAFSVCAPKLWNDIPEIINCSENLNTFKRNLKTYLFKRYFNE